MKETLTQVADGVFSVERDIHLGLSFRLPLRMTILSDAAGLVLVSPVRLDDALVTAISNLGHVHTLLAPNRLHHKFMKEARRSFPEARVLLAPGLAEKRSDLPCDGVLQSGALSEQIQTLLIEGAEQLSEVVLFHTPSRTLVVTDLVFNVRAGNWMTRFVLSTLSGAYGQLMQSKLLRSMTDDRGAAKESAARVLQFPIERVVPAHGEIVEQEALAQLERALFWMLGRDRPNMSKGHHARG